MTNRIFSITLIVIVLGGAATSAAAEKVFGFEFGQTIEAPPCRMAGHISLNPTEGYCATNNNRLVTQLDNGATIEQMRLLFKFRELPFWTGDKLDIILVDGKLEGIIASTGGRNTHLSVHGDLTKRFGEPNAQQRTEAQNTLGATFDNTILLWSNDRFGVTYIPLLGAINVGQVEVSTKIGVEARSKILQRRTGPAPSRPL